MCQTVVGYINEINTDFTGFLLLDMLCFLFNSPKPLILLESEQCLCIHMLTITGICPIMNIKGFRFRHCKAAVTITICVFSGKNEHEAV